MDEIFFSIIVAVYNAEKTILRCLNSIQSIDSDCFEVIIVDDGSTDGTGKICKKIVEADNRVIYYYKKNSGVSDARNYGIKVSKGKYLLFVDSDDEVKYRIDDLKYIKDPKVDLLIFGFTIIADYKKDYSPEKRGIAELTESKLIKLIDTSLINSVFNKVYKRELMPYFQSGTRIGEDFIFNIEYLKKTKRIYFVDESKYIYYQNPQSAMHNPEKISSRDAIKLMHSLYEFVTSGYINTGNGNKSRTVLGRMSAKKTMTDLTSIVSNCESGKIEALRFLNEWTSSILGDKIFRKCLRYSLQGRICLLVIKTNGNIVYLFSKLIIKLARIKYILHTCGHGTSRRKCS